MEDQPSSGPASDAEQAERLLEQARKGEQDARAALAFLTLILNRLPVALMVQDEDGNTLLANERAAALYSPAVSASEPKTAVLPAPAPAAGLAGAGVAAARDTAGTDREDDDDGISVAEDLVAGPDGERTLLSFARPARVLDRALRLTASVDFTERKLIETELSKRAYFDDLTGLPNRTLIEEHVEQLLLGGSKPQRFALAFLDIDNFKHINDYYTHSVGDALLVKVAQRITSHLRSSDILSRISGDEFLLVLNPLTGNGDLAVVDSRLRQLKEPFLIEGFEILTSASMGVSVYPDHGLNYEMLRHGADTAMYRIKASAKGGAALFDADLGRSMAARMGREQRLRLAVRDGRFCCAFQPKVDIRTEEIVGVEALIRLRDEEGMIQAPSEFIGLAVELGLIERLTYLALGEIIRSMDLIDEAFGPAATLSINVAAKQVGDLNFMRGFCDELSSTTYPNRFMVEVTEDAFVAKTQFQTHVLPMLREIGAKVSIDDFGTGYSSLAALADITADELKIDRSFITDIHKRTRSQSVLKAIEALAEPLGMTMIAEGVETFEEAAYLQAATRIRFAQGFYYSKPVLLEELRPARSGSDARAIAARRGRSVLRGGLRSVR
jgi:cyclic di-GMP phosphodiesterase Gmr